MDLEDFLCCPHCKGEFDRTAVAFICLSCNRRYDMAGGVPVLIDLANVAPHLSSQIHYFKRETSRIGREYEIRPWQEKYVDRFLETFPDPRESLVVELGAGSGYMAIELARRGAKVIATDLTLSSMVRLREIAHRLNLADHLLPVCCSAEELPINSNSADFLIANALLEHVPQENATLLEIDRVCRTEASLMVAVPLAYRLLNPLLLPINWLHDKRIGHLRRYDLKSLESRFQNWSLLRTYYTGHFGKTLKTLFNMFALSLFDEDKIELKDSLKASRKYGASNIIIMFARRADV